MPHCIPNKLKEHSHLTQTKSNNSLYPVPPKFTTDQKQPETDNTSTLLPKQKKLIQEIVAFFLYNALAIDITMLKLMNSIASQQTGPTESMERLVRNFLD